MASTDKEGREDMAVAPATIVWGSHERNILTLFIEPTPEYFGVDTFDDPIAVYREMDEDENEETMGKIVAVEIIDFLSFDDWAELPELDVLLQAPGWEPLPLVDLLKREQERLREQAEAA